MGHPGFAIRLVPRTNEVGHVDRNGGFAWIRKQDHLETVLQTVFTDTFNARNLPEVFRSEGRQSHQCNKPTCKFTHFVTPSATH